MATTPAAYAPQQPPSIQTPPSATAKSMPHPAAMAAPIAPQPSIGPARCLYPFQPSTGNGMGNMNNPQGSDNGNENFVEAHSDTLKDSSSTRNRSDLVLSRPSSAPMLAEICAAAEGGGSDVPLTRDREAFAWHQKELPAAAVSGLDEEGKGGHVVASASRSTTKALLRKLGILAPPASTSACARSVATRAVQGWQMANKQGASEAGAARGPPTRGPRTLRAPARASHSSTDPASAWKDRASNGQEESDIVDRVNGVPRYLELQNKRITGPQAKKLCAALATDTSLVSLKVGCNELGDEGAEAVAQALAHHPSLITLDLGFNGIGDRGAEALAGSLWSNRRLKTLYLSGNCIGVRGAQALGRALQQNMSLEVLHLTGNAVSAGGAALMGQGLAHNRSLRSLYLAGNALGPQGSAELFGGLARNAGLECLFLSDSGIGDEGAVALAGALLRHRRLRVLELGFNRLTAVGIAPLLAALQGCTHLQVLRLDNNEVDNGGAAEVARALHALTDLQVLDVGFNAMRSDGVATLMRAVAGHASLRALTLSGNTLKTEGAKAVAEALLQNNCLQELYLDHTSIGSAGERFLASGLAGNPCLGLCVLTGLRLGNVLARLGGGQPQGLDALSNEQSLAFLRLKRREPEADVRQLVAMVAARMPAARNSASSPRTPASWSVQGGGECEGGAATKGEEKAGLGASGGGGWDETAMMMLSTPPLPTFYSRSGGQEKHAHRPRDQVHPPDGMAAGSLPPALACGLVACTKAPFDGAELSALHHFYFSPPPNAVGTAMGTVSPPGQHYYHHRGSLIGGRRDEAEAEAAAAYAQQQNALESASSGQERLAAGSASENAAAIAGNNVMMMMRVESEAHLPPTKRQCNLNSRVRVAAYPHLQRRLEVMLSNRGREEPQVLTLLRQLRFLEENVGPASKPCYTPETLENVLLRSLSTATADTRGKGT